jgi:hypothetical protein
MEREKGQQAYLIHISVSFSGMEEIFSEHCLAESLRYLAAQVAKNSLLNNSKLLTKL